MGVLTPLKVVQQYVWGLDSGRPHSRVSALEWGVPRDGTGDASTPLNAAIAYLSANESFSTLVIPPGTYRVPEAVHLKSNVQIIGAGMMNTILQAVSGGDYSMESPVTRTAIVGGVNVDDVEVAGIGVDANGETGVSGICIFGGTRPSIHHCMVKDHGGGAGSAIQFYGAQQVGSNAVYDGEMHSNYVQDYRWAFVCDGFVVNATITGNRVLMQVGVSADWADRPFSVDGNEGAAVAGKKAAGISIVGNAVRGGYGLFTSKTAETVVVSGNTAVDLWDANEPAIRVNNLEATIVGNVLARRSSSYGSAVQILNGLGSKHVAIRGNTFKNFTNALTMSAAGSVEFNENTLIAVTTPKNFGEFGAGVVFERNYNNGVLVT